MTDDTLMKSEKVESHEEAIVRHLKAIRIAQIKAVVEQEASTIRKVKTLKTWPTRVRLLLPNYGLIPVLIFIVVEKRFTVCWSRMAHFGFFHLCLQSKDNEL